MAEKRMFAKSVVDSDAFIDMPLTAQALYFHLAMRADDDGFINNSRKITRMINASEEDFQILCAKNFVISFDSGIAVIKHWKLHNSIRGDRKKDTNYAEEFALLSEKENGIYTLCQPLDGHLTDKCLSSDGQMTAQIRIEENRRDKGSIDIKEQDNAQKINEVINSIDNTLLKTRIIEYLEMRSEINAPIKTPNALRILLNRLKELAPNDTAKQIHIIENAILGKWKNIYAPSAKEEPTESSLNFNLEDIYEKPTPKTAAEDENVRKRMEELKKQIQEG